MLLKGMLWFVQVIAAAILVSFLSIWTAGYIITSYVDAILKQYEIPLKIEPFAVSGVWGKLWGADQPSRELAITLPDSGSQLTEEEVEGNTIQEEEVEAEEAMAPLVEEEVSTELALSAEDIIDARDTITEEDKEVLFQLLMTKLPPEAWQMFSTYAEDGLTEQELIEIQQLMAQYLTNEEYEELMIILKKY